MILIILGDIFPISIMACIWIIHLFVQTPKSLMARCSRHKMHFMVLSSLSSQYTLNYTT